MVTPNRTELGSLKKSLEIFERSKLRQQNSGSRRTILLLFFGSQVSNSLF